MSGWDSLQIKEQKAQEDLTEASIVQWVEVSRSMCIEQEVKEEEEEKEKEEES